MAPQAAIMRQRAKPERRARHYLSRFLPSSRFCFFCFFFVLQALSLSLSHIHTVTHVIQAIMQLKIREKSRGGEMCYSYHQRSRHPQVLEAHYSTKIACQPLRFSFYWSVSYLPFWACLFELTAFSLLNVNLNLIKTSFILIALPSQDLSVHTCYNLFFI